MADTIGISIGETDDLVERFDDTFGCGPGGRQSRSAEIKRAMELRMAIESVMASQGHTLPDGPGGRHRLRQLVLNALRLEDAGVLEPALEQLDEDG